MNSFAISLYKGASADTILLKEYGRLEPAARRKVNASLSAITISVLHEGHEYLNALTSLGALKTLIPQLTQALQHLRGHKMALVRSGVLDSPVGYYFLFEPMLNTDIVQVSFVQVEGPEVSHLFPNLSQAVRLYEHVRLHRSKFTNNAKQSQLLWEQLPFSLTELCNNLEEDIAAGNELLATVEKQGG